MHLQTRLSVRQASGDLAKALKVPAAAYRSREETPQFRRSDGYRAIPSTVQHVSAPLYMQPEKRAGRHLGLCRLGKIGDLEAWGRWRILVRLANATVAIEPLPRRRDALPRPVCRHYLAAVPPALSFGPWFNLQAVGAMSRHGLMDGRMGSRQGRRGARANWSVDDVLEEGYRMQYDVLSIRKIIPWREWMAGGGGAGSGCGSQAAAHSPIQPRLDGRCGHKCQPSSQAGQQPHTPSLQDTVEQVARGRGGEKPTTGTEKPACVQD
ncbi:hypothetical protein RB595_008447 [Gaeumannomyces hyphopodioides]